MRKLTPESNLQAWGIISKSRGTDGTEWESTCLSLPRYKKDGQIWLRLWKVFRDGKEEKRGKTIYISDTSKHFSKS